jgi:clan AA aspartic protease (TIGR02281 family)
MLVRILERSSNRGKAWVYISTANNSVPLGWVFRDYLDCQHIVTLSSEEGNSSTSPTPGSSPSHTVIRLKNDGGIFTVPVEINGTINLDFVLDSGASDVLVPADVVSTLIRTGTIRQSDFIGQQTYILADGTEAPSDVFIIRSLKVGDNIIENVRGSIASPKASLLLGQSFLRHFKSWSIDNARRVLVLE